MGCSVCGQDYSVERKPRSTGGEWITGEFPSAITCEYFKVCGCTQFDNEGKIIEDPDWPEIIE